MPTSDKRAMRPLVPDLSSDLLSSLQLWWLTRHCLLPAQVQMDGVFKSVDDQSQSELPEADA